MPTVLPLEPTVAAQRTPAWAAALTARLDQRASPTPAQRAVRDAARAAHAPALVAAQHRLALLAALAAPPRRLP